MKFFTCAVLLSIMLVTQVNAEARIRFTEPTSGFFCLSEYFCVEIDSRGMPAPLLVTLEWRDALDEAANWQEVSNPDSQEPWCFTLPASDFENVREGFHQFRALVVDAHGTMTYSDHIALFFDNTPPVAKLVSISDGDSVKQYTSREEIVFPVGTEVLYFTFQAIDNLSSWGPSPVYNSGVGAVLCNRVAEDAVQKSDGSFTYTYDVSMQGVPVKPLTFTVYDEVGCNGTDIQAWVTFR